MALRFTDPSDAARFAALCRDSTHSTEDVRRLEQQLETLTRGTGVVTQATARHFFAQVDTYAARGGRTAPARDTGLRTGRAHGGGDPALAAIPFASAADARAFRRFVDQSTYDDAGKQRIVDALRALSPLFSAGRMSREWAAWFMNCARAWLGKDPDRIVTLHNGAVKGSFRGFKPHAEQELRLGLRLSAIRFARPEEQAAFDALLNKHTYSRAGQIELLRAAERLPRCNGRIDAAAAAAFFAAVDSMLPAAARARGTMVSFAGLAERLAP